MRYKDSPEPCPEGMVPPGSDNKVLHACLRIGETAVMASDGSCQGKPSFAGFALSLTAANEAEADRLFAALADGGQVQMPLGKTFFARASVWSPTVRGGVDGARSCLTGAWALATKRKNILTTLRGRATNQISLAH